jgi:hypothetical protein
VKHPSGIVVDPSGVLFVADVGGHVIKRIDLASDRVTVVAGIGMGGLGDDGRWADEVPIHSPGALVQRANGDLLFTEGGNGLVRVLERVVLPNGTDRFRLQSLTRFSPTAGACSGNFSRSGGTAQGVLSEICRGFPQSLAIHDGCRAEGGRLRVAYGQSFGHFDYWQVTPAVGNLVVIDMPCEAMR